MKYKKYIRREMRIGNRVFFNEFEINVFLIKIKMEMLFTIENQRIPAHRAARATFLNCKKILLFN